MADIGSGTRRIGCGWWKHLLRALDTAPDGRSLTTGADAGISFPEGGMRCDIATTLLGTPRYRR